ncbi:hypothetical protein BST61_g7895 [Cercospora zeina]
MPPIRVGILGLSATSSWAVQAHLPYLISSPKYIIAGVCNSSRESSQKAIDAHSLKDAKPYSFPTDLAASSEIDLVVCAVRVDRHYNALKPAIAAGSEYLNFKELGGNMLVIPFGHLYDSVSYVLGELQYVSATLSTQFPDVAVKSSAGKIVDTIKRTTADQISMSGLLASGAHSSAVVHGSGPFKGEPALVWRIEGDKGIIELRGETAFAVSMSGQVKIRLQDFASGEVKNIDFEGGTSGPPENIGRLYEAFADGKDYPDWKWAVKRHAWVDALYESHERGKRASYAGSHGDQSVPSSL